MKTMLTIFGIILGIFLFFLFVGNISSSKRDKETKQVVDKHCQIDWSETTAPGRAAILEEFAETSALQDNGKGKSISEIATVLLNGSVKYPKTLKINGEKPEHGFVFLSLRHVVDTEPEEGIITFSETFTSENKLGMDVNGQFWLKVKYNAGCQPYKLLDFQVE
jgi:hypothetical protein